MVTVILIVLDFRPKYFFKKLNTILLYKITVDKYKQDRNIVELPILKYYKKSESAHELWFNHIETIYFFKNQSELFDCYLTILNKTVCLSYNIRNSLSFDFMQFVTKSVPTNPRDKKKRFYKPTNTI